jgi:nitrile hydratase accessory protein
VSDFDAPARQLPSLPGLPGLPGDAAGPVFRAPWQAHAFALVLALHERGVFTWPEWAAALAAAIHRAERDAAPDPGERYYHHWLEALESLVLARGLARSDTLHALEHAWQAAAERTAHGQPIVLSAAEAALARDAAPTPPEDRP